MPRTSALSRRLALLVALLWLGFVPSLAKAEVTIEELLKTLVQQVEVPSESPPWTLISVRNEGTTMFRVLRLSDPGFEKILRQASGRILDGWKAGLKKSQQDLFCRSDFRELLDKGVTVRDLLQMPDGSEILTVNIDSAACEENNIRLDFSGPDQASATLNADLKAYVRRQKVPLGIGAMSIERVETSGRTLKRRLMTSSSVLINELRVQGEERARTKDSWHRVICTSNSLSRLILKGAKIEDSMVTQAGEVLAVIMTDRAACHRLSLSD